MSDGERIYFQLEITADTPDTEIWLGDDQGSLVVKKVGHLQEPLLHGDYVVEFGLGTPCYPVPLHRDTSYTQCELQLGGPCERPMFEVPDTEEPKPRPVDHPILREILAKLDSGGS